MKIINSINKKFYEYNLRFGLNAKNEGLIWIFEYLDGIPR